MKNTHIHEDQKQIQRKGLGEKRYYLITGIIILVFSLGLVACSKNSTSTEEPVDPNTPGGLLWQIEANNPDYKKVRGFWHVGDTIVQAVSNTLNAYSISDGSLTWSLKLEGKTMCVPSTPSKDGKVVIGHGVNCGQNITLVDLKSGKKGWSQPLKPTDDPGGFQIAIADESYAIHTRGGWNLHRIEDGKLITAGGSSYNSLNHKVNPMRKDRVTKNSQEICAADGVAGGEALIRRLTCATVINAKSHELSDPYSKIQQINPDDGETMWSLDVPKDKKFHKIFSVSPLVVSFQSKSKKIAGALDYEFAHISDGKIISQFSVESFFPDRKNNVGQFMRQFCRDEFSGAYHKLDDCEGIAIHGDLLYASTSSVMRPDKSVTAINLRTGVVEWSHTADMFRSSFVLDADKNGVIVFQVGLRGIHQVIRLSPDGKESEEALFRTDGDAWPSPRFFQIYTNESLIYSSPSYQNSDFTITAIGPEGSSKK